MKILYLITRAESGGAQTHLVDLMAGMLQSCDIALGVGEEGYLTQAARQMSIPVHVLPSLVQPMSPAKDARAFGEIIRLIRSVNPDLIHAHTSKAGILGRFAAAALGKPSVFTAHTWCFAEGTSWHWKWIGKPLERIAALYSQRIINVSEANRTLALRHRIASPSKLCTIHNGIPEDTISSLSTVPSEQTAPVVVMIGRFVPQKDHPTLIRALTGIGEPYNVVLPGDGPTRSSIAAMVREAGLEANVSFPGSRRDVPAILARADIFVLSSNWEGFPITILEAMRAGLPVVATDVGGVREAVVDGETGYLCQTGDVPGLRERLQLLLSNPAKRRQMGAAGRQRYQDLFTAAIMNHKTYEVYQAATRTMPVSRLTPKLERVQ